ncbi:MAG TPA: EamA family transporter [Candidatus Angelobacter sp.]|jgi:drug/metabolite transporter (DMT)-like permease|nr:EamA family transporter [Candidatus Angelobacter sp.]
MNAVPQNRSRIIVAFALLYVLWGSTYLAMRVIVRDMPPYVAGAVRYLSAGPIMLAACALMGRKISLTRLDLRRLLVISILLLSIGNIGVLWGEEYVSSGLASLIVALVPIWVVMIEAWVFRAGRMTAKGLIGLAIGIVGLLVLLWPRITAGTHLGHMELIGSAILAGASFFWALGSVLSHRFSLTVDVFASAAWQMTLAGAVNGVIALVTGQFQKTHWTSSALSGIGYLVIFGSWIGYSAYIYLLEHVPTPKVATYAYVNPIVAVFLGWIILREQVDAFMLLGTAIIIASVALVNTSKLRHAPADIPVSEETCPKTVNVAGD